MNKIDLNGRCAVVTGGAQGFGRAITERFVASGAKVAIWDHDLPFAEKTAKEIGPAVSAFKVDVSDLAAVEKTRDETLKALGKIDILVNNAGIAGVNKPVWETDRRRMAQGAAHQSRRPLHLLQGGRAARCSQQKYGRIVNIASIAGKEGNPNAAHYSASKAGLIALTKSLGKELAQHDILVNAVTPAAAKTAIFDQMTQQHIDFMLSKIPKGALRAGRRTRGDGRVAGVGRLRVLHRRGVRHFRRPGDVLTWARSGKADASAARCASRPRASR